MRWFAVDTRFITHGKMRRAIKQNRGALEMWMAMRAFVAEHETDGTVPNECVDALGGAPKNWKQALHALLDQGLIVQGKNEWVFHDFDQHAKEIGAVQKKREKERLRKQAARKAGQSAETGADCPRTKDGTVPHGSSLELEGELESTVDVDPEPDTSDHPSGVQRLPQPTSWDEAVKVPLRERCEYLLANEHLGDYLEPNRWPEIRDPAETLSRNLGQPCVLGRWPRDSGLRALVACYAAGLTLEQVNLIVENAPNDPWWKNGSRGLSSLSLEVARRALAIATQSDSWVMSDAGGLE